MQVGTSRWYNQTEGPSTPHNRNQFLSSPTHSTFTIKGKKTMTIAREPTREVCNQKPSTERASSQSTRASDDSRERLVLRRRAWVCSMFVVAAGILCIQRSLFSASLASRRGLVCRVLIDANCLTRLASYGFEWFPWFYALPNGVPARKQWSVRCWLLVSVETRVWWLGSGFRCFAQQFGCSRCCFSGCEVCFLMAPKFYVNSSWSDIRVSWTKVIAASVKQLDIASDVVCMHFSSLGARWRYRSPVCRRWGCLQSPLLHPSVWTELEGMCYINCLSCVRSSSRLHKHGDHEGFCAF